METPKQRIVADPAGEQPSVEVRSAIADTFAGRIHIEWDAATPVAALDQLPFFIDYLKQAGLFNAWVANCPLSPTSPKVPRRRDLFGSVLLFSNVGSSPLRAHHRVALRSDEPDSARHAQGSQRELGAPRPGQNRRSQRPTLPAEPPDHCTTPLLSEPWILDMDSTVKTLYREREGARINYNPHQPGRPSHALRPKPDEPEPKRL